jgi:hypothetical protein
MPTHKKKPRPRPKKVYSQIGCASKKRHQKGGALGLMHADPPILFSRTMYPYNEIGNPPNPIDASMQKGGSKKKRRYSRKYYKQSGGSGFSGPANYSQQPINVKFHDTNRFRV